MKTLSRSVFTIFVVVLFIFLGGTSQMSAQWKKVANLPAPYDQGYYLDVYFLPSNPLYGWVCGFDGYMLRTTDGGLTWQGVTITFFDPQDSRAPMLESVSFVTPLIGYTSGKHGIYKTSDGGVNWTDVTPQNIDRQRLWGCFFLNTNVGLVVGGGCPYFDPVQKVVRRDNQSFYRTTNGGNTWAEFRGGYDNSGMTDAMIYSENGLGYASSSGMIWNTLDGGKTWKEFSPTGTNDWQEEITNIGSSFLVPTAGTSCDGGGTGGSLRFSTDNGLSWKRYSTGESMYGTFLSNLMTGWGVGSNRAVYYTNDGGVSWVNRNCVLKQKTVSMIFTSSPILLVGLSVMVYIVRITLSH
ncbi:MAG: hypothetical protein IPM69_01905 [Ignavibacteria bacterium]|nr:hypothetical protein [Ignavibacteria bacterium]